MFTVYFNLWFVIMLSFLLLIKVNFSEKYGMTATGWPKVIYMGNLGGRVDGKVIESKF